MLHKAKVVVIVCDKCHDKSTASLTDYNNVFSKEGWSFQRTRTGVKHICFNCKTAKQKKATLFVKAKFDCATNNL